MTFPVHQSSANTQGTTNATSHNVALPTGFTAGDRIIGVFISDGTPTITLPSGWIQIGIVNRPSGCRVVYFYKDLDGSETDPITFTTSASEGINATLARVTGFDPDYPPEIIWTWANSGTSADPPDHDPPGWEGLDTLWFALAGSNSGSGNGLSGTPTNYANAAGSLGAAGFSGATSSRLASRQLNATSDDPSAFTISATTDWSAATMAIRPIATVDPAPTPFDFGSTPYFSNSDTTSHVITLPSYRQAGDRIVLWFVCDAVTTITLPAGWTRIGSDTNAGAGTCTACSAYRDLDGSEADTITITTSTSEGASWVLTRVADYDPGTAPERGTATGSSTSADPPSLSPSWGTAGVLWLALAASKTGSHDGMSGTPSGYINAAGMLSDFGHAGGVASRKASKFADASSEDPGAFTVSVSAAWVAATIAVKTTGPRAVGGSVVWVD